ncbi:MAG: hypothetical protein FJY88_03580 [Candidatus Eisenbacteria bacterium]|nr:hypothetical protein [Candidatus Eisenbacteria bacterium]
MSWLADLQDLKVRFGPAAARRKRTILQRAARASVEDPAALVEYHEALCFIRAFPDDRSVLEAAGNELRLFARRVAPMKDDLVDTGIAGTIYHYPFDLPMASWLVDRFGDAVDIDWDEYDGREEDNLSTILPPLSGWVETAALDDELLGTHEWFERSAGRSKAGSLRRLIRRLRGSGLPAEVQETLYNSMNVPVRWDLGESRASRTLARMQGQPFYYHKSALRGRAGDLRREIRRPLDPLRPVPRGRARLWIDLARCALSVRDRELYPLALANPGEVYEVGIGRGVTFVLIGMSPRRRLPIESDYAAFVCKNGIPIGYALGALLFDRVEIAVNVFPTFRQGESSFVFEQFARIFHHQFGPRSFFIERYQLGHENDEGLEAGSFWFYYKLGFRPIDAKVATLAEQEAERIRRVRGARTARPMLRRLARSHVIMRLDREPPSASGEIPLTEIGLAVSRLIEERFRGDLAGAESACAARVARLLGAGSPSSWPESEREAFLRLSPLASLLPGLGAWTAREKRDLARIMRAKGATGEAAYARAVIRHPKLKQALLAMAEG